MLLPQRLLIAAIITVTAIAGASLALYFRAGVPGAPVIPPAALAQLQTSAYPDVNNESQPFSQWQGKVVVLNFWATWCPPCRTEMPMFSKMHQDLTAQGVQFVGIGIDSPSAIKEFALREPVSYPLLIGGSQAIELARALGNPNGALPYTVVFDRSGQPVMSRLGLIDEASLGSVLKPLLGRESKG